MDPSDVLLQAGAQRSELGWVDPWVGSGWVEIFQFLVGWVGSTIAKVLKSLKDYVSAFKARLDKIWLHQAVKFVSCRPTGLGRVGSKFFH